MLKNIGTILILSTLVLLSCQDSSQKAKEQLLQKEKEQLYSDVMAVHDEMMMMQKIRSAQKKLEGMIETATEQGDSASVMKYKTAHEQLGIADDAMMDWMKQFKNPTEETSNKEAIKYLKNQKEKVMKMKEVMVENLDKAKEVIEF